MQLGPESPRTYSLYFLGKYINGVYTCGCMRFAVTYDDGQVFQHFGQTRQFKVFDSETGESSILDSGSYSHGGLAELLGNNGISALICGGIGDGARNMLMNRGIQVYPGISGSADDAAKALIDGNLACNGRSTCDHDHDCHCHD